MYLSSKDLVCWYFNVLIVTLSFSGCQSISSTVVLIMSSETSLENNNSFSSISTSPINHSLTTSIFNSSNSSYTKDRSNTHNYSSMNLMQTSKHKTNTSLALSDIMDITLSAVSTDTISKTDTFTFSSAITTENLLKTMAPSDSSFQQETINNITVIQTSTQEKLSSNSNNLHLESSSMKFGPKDNLASSFQIIASPIHPSLSALSISISSQDPTIEPSTLLSTQFDTTLLHLSSSGPKSMQTDTLSLSMSISSQEPTIEPSTLLSTQFDITSLHLFSSGSKTMQMESLSLSMSKSSQEPTIEPSILLSTQFDITSSHLSSSGPKSMQTESLSLSMSKSSQEPTIEPSTLLSTQFDITSLHLFSSGPKSMQTESLSLSMSKSSQEPTIEPSILLSTQFDITSSHLSSSGPKSMQTESLSLSMSKSSQEPTIEPSTLLSTQFDITSLHLFSSGPKSMQTESLSLSMSKSSQEPTIEPSTLLSTQFDITSLHLFSSGPKSMQTESLSLSMSIFSQEPTIEPSTLLSTQFDTTSLHLSSSDLKSMQTESLSLSMSIFSQEPTIEPSTLLSTQFDTTSSHLSSSDLKTMQTQVSSTSISKSSQEITIQPSIEPFTSLSNKILQSTAGVVTDDKLLLIELRVPVKINIDTPEFKDNAIKNLNSLYIQGKNSRRKRRNIQPSLQITRIFRKTSNSENVEILFYVQEGGDVLPAQQVQTVLKKIPMSMMDSQLGYPVLLIKALTTTSIVSGDDFELWVILLAVFVPVIVILILIIFVNCYRNRAQKKMQLHPISEKEEEPYLIEKDSDLLPAQKNIYAEEKLTPIFSHNYKQKMPTTKLNKKYEEKESKEIHHFGSKSQMKNLKSKPVFQQLLQPEQSKAAEIENLTRECKLFQANSLSHKIGVRLHADILSPQSSARSVENGSSTSIEMSPIQRNGFGVEDSNLIDSAHHINIMKKISELQLTVDSLQNKKNKTEENSQKVKEYPENDETAVAKIRNKERVRKRELAKAERRLKRNEVIDINNSTSFDVDEQDNVNQDDVSYVKKKKAVNIILKMKKKKRRGQVVSPLPVTTDTEESPRSLYTSDDNDEKPSLYKQSKSRYTEVDEMLQTATMSQPYQGRLPPLHFQSPYLPAAFQPHLVSGEWDGDLQSLGNLSNFAYYPPLPHGSFYGNMPLVSPPWGKLRLNRTTPSQKIRSLSLDSQETNNNEDTSGDNSSAILLPNGRGQPRKKIRHVTGQDIESLERAQASARNKLKNILDKATEDAKELVRSPAVDG